MENAACYAPQILVSTEDLPREQWLEYRRKGIGGSDAAAVLGISPFHTGRDLYYDKLNIVTADDAENWVQLEVGTLLEPLVAKIFAHKTGYKIYRRPFVFQHPLYPWMLADLDYMVELPDGTTAILEIKTTNYNAKDNWWYNGEEIVPIYYESQGRHYNDAAYAKSCGRTGHHYKDGLAFKFEDDTYETALRSIEWTPSRTGEITPVAVFDTVEIDGCAVSRASLHNLSFIENLELAPGCRIKVSKRNQIIPHVEENLDRDCYAREKVVPARCPCCGQPTRIHTTKNTVNGEEKVTAALFCDNEQCETRKLRKFVHFVGEKAMDIEGLSEATLEKFIGRGFLHSFMDIYRLDRYRTQIIAMDGFGEKSWQRLWEAIQRSRNVTFEQYLTAMDIPMIGNTASRTLSRQFNASLDAFEIAIFQQFDFTQLPDFGETLHKNICDWFQSEENWYTWSELRNFVTIAPPAPSASVPASDNPFVGKTIVVTGKVEPYTRDGINEKIESLGAHAGSSVSSKTDYLICGENAGSKLEKARSMGVTVLSPAEFFSMIDA